MRGLEHHIRILYPAQLAEITAALDNSAPNEFSDALYDSASDWSLNEGRVTNSLLEPLGELSAQHVRVWLILSHDSGLERSRQSNLFQVLLQNEYSLVEKQEFKRVTVLLYEQESYTNELLRTE